MNIYCGFAPYLLLITVAQHITASVVTLLRCWSVLNCSVLQLVTVTNEPPCSHALTQ